MKTRLPLAFLASCVILLASVSAQVSNSQIDAIFDSLKSTDAPGAAVLVVRDGKPVFRRGYGVTDLSTRHPIGAETDFRLASFTKQFTATCIMLWCTTASCTRRSPHRSLSRVPGIASHHRSQPAQHFRPSRLRDPDEAVSQYTRRQDSADPRAGVLKSLERRAAASFPGVEMAIQQF